MNSFTKATILVLLGLTVLLAAGALMAAADPADTAHEPTEDWVFDEGKTTTIKDRTWTIEYSITVMNGSKLVLDGCTWIFNGDDEFNPIFISTQENSTLEIKNCEFSGADGSLSFYIEAHDTLNITNSVFTGMTLNPTSDGCIACYECDVVIDFVEFRNNRAGNGIYAHNCQIFITNSKVSDTKLDGIYLFVGDNPYNASYTARIWDTEVWNITGDGISLQAYTNYGNAYLQMFNVKIHDTKDNGITVDVGDPSWTGRVGVVTTILDAIPVDVKVAPTIVCGPPLMMKFTTQRLVQAGFADRNIYLSMEKNMACGIGKCNHCRAGKYYCCKDGPVLTWDIVKDIEDPFL